MHITLSPVKLVRKAATNDVVEEFDRDLVRDAIVQEFESMSLVSDLVYREYTVWLHCEPFDVLLR